MFYENSCAKHCTWQENGRHQMIYLLYLPIIIAPAVLVILICMARMNGDLDE